MDYPFVKGMILTERLYHEGVKPVMARRFSGLRYTAARLGRGSDTLGYDTPLSMDHGWGPTVEVYLSAEDHPQYVEPIAEMMRRELPREIAGVPAHFDSTSHETGKPERLDCGPIEHRVRPLRSRALPTRHTFQRGPLNCTTRPWSTTSGGTPPTWPSTFGVTTCCRQGGCSTMR